MVSIEELDKTILELESRDTTFANCERLAWLYIVKDHLAPVDIHPKNDDISIYGDSEFIQASNGKSTEKVLYIIADLMDTIRLTAPRAYEHVIRQIKEL